MSTFNSNTHETTPLTNQNEAYLPPAMEVTGLGVAEESVPVVICVSGCGGSAETSA